MLRCLPRTEPCLAWHTSEKWNSLGPHRIRGHRGPRGRPRAERIASEFLHEQVLGAEDEQAVRLLDVACHDEHLGDVGLDMNAAPEKHRRAEVFPVVAGINLVE